jgi:AcrR family transcriptional regulator
MNENKKKETSASEKILNAAAKLFYEEGIQSVGIDRIIKEADVAMNTMYKHFPSKDLLIEEYLKRRDVKWRAWFMSYAKPDETAQQNILSLFDALNDWFHEDGFRGCAFINVAGELGDSKPDIFEISKEHKELIYADVLKLCKEFRAKEPETLTRQLMILIEGAIVRAYINDDKDAGICAKEIAKELLKS